MKPLIYSFILLAMLTGSKATSFAACSESLGGYVINRTVSGVLCVTNDLWLSNVTAMPGTTFLLNTNATLHVLGPIHFVGTSNAPVILVPSTGNADGWQSLVFENTACGSELEFVRLEGAKNSALTLIRSTALIRNCIFTNNCGPNGGAINVSLTSGDLIITNCIFASNYSVYDGGAFWGNMGTGKVHFARCTFIGNSANYQFLTRDSVGGAICLQGSGEFTRCDFRMNEVHAYTIYSHNGIRTFGGAMWSSGSVTLTACNFISNACAMTAHVYTPDPSFAYGAALFLASGSLLVSNSLFADNWLSAQNGHIYNGSAVYVSQGSFAAINCTFADNKSAAAIHNEGGSVDMCNSIAYFNFDHITQISGSAAVAYSDIQAGYSGLGNIDINPVWDPNYRVLPGSLCIDGGDPASQFNDVAFPPSLGTARCDQGYLGGPGAGLWLDVPFTGPQEMFKLDLGNVVIWTDRPNTTLECAADPNGSWDPYTGDILSLGSRRAVVMDTAAPRKFFRLVKY